MKKQFTQMLLAAVAAAGSLQIASALNYHGDDMLLVFRQDGFSDVEFDLGSVSNYLSLANGTQVTVNYDSNLVSSNFNNGFTGVRFIVMAATALGDPLGRLWLTDANLSSVPTDVTGSKFNNWRSKFQSVGDAASLLTSSNAAPFIISATDPNSYSYLVSNGGSVNSPPTGIGNWAGDSTFVVEAVNPASLAFYDIRPSGTTPKPPARRIGTFTMAANGAITFTAGPPAVSLPPSMITGIVASGDTKTVFFTTTNGANYRLAYAAGLTNGMGTNSWTQLPGSITGNGATRNLSDTTTDPERYYQIQTY